MITQPNIKVKKNKKKKKGMEEPEPQPQPIKDRAYFIKKCEQFTKEIEDKIAKNIFVGEVKIRETSSHLELKQKQEESVNDMPQKDIKDKLNSLNHDLESLQQQILKQKEEEKRREESKRKQAKVLIERLKKEKEEHRNRIKFNQINSRLKDNVFSEDVLRMMREHREKLITEKKKDMELKIYQNINRRYSREEENAKNEVSYWVKIQEIQSKKRYHSTKALPKLENHQSQHQPEFGVNISRKNLIIPRKNSRSLHVKSKSRQDILDYPEMIQRFLERAKAKQESKSQKSPRVNGKSRINEFEAISEKDHFLQNGSRVSVQNEKIDRIMASHLENKRKVLGDEYLKESLLRVKSPRNISAVDDSRVEDTLELKANPAIFSRNDRLANLEERRQKIFDQLLRGKIQKSLAIQMLHPIDNKLDRIHPSGIEDRLKSKLEIFEKHQRLLKSYGNENNDNDQSEESSEHGI